MGGRSSARRHAGGKQFQAEAVMDCFESVSAAKEGSWQNLAEMREQVRQPKPIVQGNQRPVQI
jgi:hypothetical protein